VNNLEKVRDILFGSQMRDVEKKFARLEERLLKECTSLREDTTKRLDSIENYIKQEVESLSQRIISEQGKRDEGIQALVEDNKRITTALDKKLTQLDENISTSQRDLREQILSQSKTLQNDILQKYEEVLAALQRESEELRHAKTDRSTLANLLSEIAIRLNSQQ
jgi:DNA anti-recombination protein RmuC